MNNSCTSCGSDTVSFSNRLKFRPMLKTIHYKYNDFYPVVKSSNDKNVIVLNFRVKAYSNAHIVFSPTSELKEGMPVYEIVLGANHNKYCCIRRQQLKDVRTHVEFKNIVSGDEWRSFWVRVSNGGLIEIGNKGNDLPFMLWEDSSPLDIQYYSFSSWVNTVALWSWYFDSPDQEDDDFDWLTGTAESSFSE